MEVASHPLHALDCLLAVDDASRLGALRFQDEDGAFRGAGEGGRRTAPPLIELGHLLSASHAVETHTETVEDLRCLRGRGTSLGGLRPKCTVVDDDGRLSIGKFPSIADDRAVTKGEVLALRLAAAAGIDAAEARLVESEGTPVALIRRFDRPDGGGRLMYVSAATMLGVEFAESGEHAYTEIVDALRMHGAAPRRRPIRRSSGDASPSPSSSPMWTIICATKASSTSIVGSGGWRLPSTSTRSPIGSRS